MSNDDTNSMRKKTFWSKLRKSKVNRHDRDLCNQIKNLPECPNQVTAANEKIH